MTQSQWDNVADLPDDSCPTCEAGRWCEGCMAGTANDENEYDFGPGPSAGFVSGPCAAPAHRDSAVITRLVAG